LISEGFHVTLKTGVMAAENSALHQRIKLHKILSRTGKAQIRP